MSRVLLFAFLLLGMVGVSGAAARSGEAPVTDINKAGATRVRVPGDWLAAGAGSVWLSDPGAKVIRRLNARTGKTVASIRVRQLPCEAPDVGFGALWTATCETPGLARIDAGSHKIRHLRLAIPTSTNKGEASIGAGAGGVWLVVDGRDCLACRVVRVAPASLRVVASIRIREFAAAVRVGQGAVWVTNPAKNVVQKIDPRTN